MSSTIINLITPPDKLHNKNYSLLLVNPSDDIKSQFNEFATGLENPINLYLYEANDDLNWLIDISQSVNSIILDIDNTKENQWVIGYLLGFGKTFYLTNTSESVYNSINVNRIYDFNQFIEGVENFGVQKK
jgi:hypothetical protein